MKDKYKTQLNKAVDILNDVLNASDLTEEEAAKIELVKQMLERVAESEQEKG